VRVPFFSTSWLPSIGGLAVEFLQRGSCCFVRRQGKSRADLSCVAKGAELKRLGRGQPDSQTREVIESCSESQYALLGIC